MTAAARVRVAGEDFETSFERLQGVVGRACSGQEEWEARVVVGIRAALEFAAANPAAARAVTVQARSRESGGDRQREVIAYFAALLGEVAPAEKRFQVSTDEGIVESILTIVRGHLLGGHTAQLPEAAPDLIYLALMPYLGLEKTKRWAESSPPLSS